MAFNTDATVKTALAAILKIDESALPSYWDTIITQAINDAYYEILGRLLRRGYSQSQITSWDRGASYELGMALRQCIIRGGAYDGFNERVIEALEKAEDLDTVLVFVSGEWVRPPEGNPGLVASGGPSADGGIFNWPDPDDANLGEITKW